MIQKLVDWEKLPKIDAHIHVIPEEIRQAYPHAEKWLLYADLETHRVATQRYNIQKSIVMPFNDSRLISLENTISAVHANLQAISEKYPGQYYCFADVDVTNDSAVSCEVIKDAHLSPHFKGVKLHPSNTATNIDDKYNDLIVEQAILLNIPVAIHSYPPSSKELDRTDHCAPARIRKLLSRHPKTCAVVCHMGGFQWEDLIGLDVYIDISAIIPEYVIRYGVSETNRILRHFPLEKLLFASDWPCSRSLSPEKIYAKYFEILNQMDFTENEARLIAYENAAKLFKLEDELLS